jgi:hypothetical protein
VRRENLQTTIDPDIKQRLERESKRLRVSRAACIDEALRLWLRRVQVHREHQSPGELWWQIAARQPHAR